MPYWVTFEKRAPASVELVQGEDVRTTAERIAGEKVTAIYSLPYPAEPRLNNVSGCPPFCYTPEQCKGKSSCPKRYACAE